MRATLPVPSSPKAVLGCYLVGGGAVAVAAAEVLLEAGQRVLGTYSFDGSLCTWSEQHGVPHAACKRDFERELLRGQFDYLFSVNNPWIIPLPVIRAARRGVINFHDSPLPKYAGLHATSWALIHGEQEHATTWHEVTEEIDAGRLYSCVRFPILPDDTAFTLNTRVLDLSIESLRLLIERLAHGDTSTRPQPALSPSYFGRSDRPEGACVLRLSDTQQRLANLVRALHFGHARNPLGTAKLQLPQGYVSVAALRRVGEPTGAPGTVHELHEQGLRVSVADADVELSGLTSLGGEPLSAARLGALIGDARVLPSLSAEQRAELSNFNQRVCAFEARWVGRVLEAHPIRVAHGARPSVLSDRTELTLHGLAGACAPEHVLAGFAAYLVRTTGCEAFDLGLGVSVPKAAESLFTQVVPLRVDVGAGRGSERFDAFARRLGAGLSVARREGSFASDVVTRYPELRARGEPLPSYPVCVSVDDVDAPNPLAGAELWLSCFTDGRAPKLVASGAHPEAELCAMAEHLTVLCRAASQDPTLKLSELPLLGASERERVLLTWNDTARPLPDVTVDGLVTQQAQQTPHRTAVRFGDETLSYLELEARANQLAGALQLYGAGPGSLLGLCLPRGVELLVGILAILKTGAAYVPIDPTYPEQRIRYLTEDSQVALVVTRRGLRARFFSDLMCVCLDEPNAFEGIGHAAVASSRSPAAPAYVIYTSGSTGSPKGAVISHRALVNHSTAVADAYGLTADDRVLQSASISFDVAAEQIFPALFRGAQVVIRSEDVLASFRAFGAFAREHRLTVMSLPTSFWHEWTAYLESTEESVPESLRVLGVGTERVLGHRLDLWQRLAAGRVRFFQGYGPTETTVTCTLFEHTDGAEFGEHGEVPIGRALPNVQLYVLDLYGQPAPIGTAGELYVGGACVSLGYHRRAEQTRERFVPNSFAGDGSRLYRTGDLVRWLPDGQLVYVGRIDGQVKVRGFRVEPGEIEAALVAYPEIEQAVVQPQPGARGEPALVAYYVVKPGAQVERADLAVRLARELPEYMVPASYQQLARLPMTPNMKVDRRALPRVRSELPCTYVAPEGELETQLTKLWEKLFEREPISVDEDFFALGGTSLLAMRLFSEIEHAFCVKLPLSTLLDCNTVRKLAASVQTPHARRGCLVELRPGGERCLFLIHEADGETLLYGNLARRMPHGIAVYGVAPVGRARLSIVHTTVEEMARHYVAEIRRRQPEGPYYLGGLCAGGVLAFEVASQLEQQGQRVGLVALIESAHPGARARRSVSSERAARFVSLSSQLASTSLASVAQQGLEKVRRLLGYELAQRRKQARVALQSWLLQRVFVGGRGWPDRLPVPTTREVYARALRGYAPTPLARGRTVLFRALDGSGDERPFRELYADPFFGWRRALRHEPEVVDVPGGHAGCLREPNVAVIANVVSAALSKPQRLQTHVRAAPLALLSEAASRACLEQRASAEVA